MRIMHKSKIHRATVTEADLDYMGSLTLDEGLMREANILENEKVQVVNLSNGERFETYTIAAEAGSGTVCLNGATARLGKPGDKIIVISYLGLSEEEARDHSPTVIHVDEENRIS